MKAQEGIFASGEIFFNFDVSSPSSNSQQTLKLYQPAGDLMTGPGYIKCFLTHKTSKKSNFSLIFIKNIMIDKLVHLLSDKSLL